MIKISVRGLEEVRKKIATLGKDAKHFAEGQVGEYLVGDMRHGLKHYPGYQYVPQSEVGGWKSDKQRRYVMAMISEGKIDPGVPHRTGELQRGWTLKDAGRFWTIQNPVDYAGWVMGETQALRQEKIGWRKWPQVVMDNFRGAIRHAQAELKKWLKTRR